MSSSIRYIRRAVDFSFLESSAKFSLGLPFGPILFGSAVWQVSQCAPSAASQPSIMSRTCCPVRFLGNTFRLVGAGKTRGGGGGPPACCCDGAGAWADWATASAAVNRATAAADILKEEDLKPVFSWLAGILFGKTDYHFPR